MRAPTYIIVYERLLPKGVEAMLPLGNILLHMLSFGIVVDSNIALKYLVLLGNDMHMFYCCGVRARMWLCGGYAFMHVCLCADHGHSATNRPKIQNWIIIRKWVQTEMKTNIIMARAWDDWQDSTECDAVGRFVAVHYRKLWTFCWRALCIV